MRRTIFALTLLSGTWATLFVLARGTPVTPPPGVLAEAELVPPAPIATAASVPTSADDLRERIGAILQREGVHGAAIAIVDRSGTQWVGGVGVANAKTREPVTADTVFRVASITKNVVGLGVMRLVEQRRLDLDKPLRQLLPDAGIDNAWDSDAPVTLGQVLEHTAGLDDMRPNEIFSESDVVTTRDALTVNPRSRVIRWRPGTRMAYSNVGYTLAGRAIEVATGEPFDTWLRREILRPLGMADADFRRTDVLASRLATGYVETDRPAPFRPIFHRPAGALLASATDLAKLVRFWLVRGEGYSIISPAGVERIERTGTLPHHLDTEYGLGNYGDVGHPLKARGHDGGLPGFVSTMRYIPELGRGYVILLNGFPTLPAWLEIRGLVFAYVSRGAALPQEPDLAAAAPPGAGFYGFASPRHQLFGFIERSLIGWRPVVTPTGVDLDPLFGGPMHMVSTADGGYRFAGQSGTSMRFAKDRTGAQVMVAAFAYAEAGSWAHARVRSGAVAIAFLVLQYYPAWAVLVLVFAAIRRRRAEALDLLLAPAVASLCLTVLPQLLFRASLGQHMGEVHPTTVGFFAVTIVFALAALVGAVAALRWWVRRDRPSSLARLIPNVAVVAAIGVTIWLGANGIIGLRTWAW
ncbi:MAG: serine hydrolase domain-containing protein [Kofleriaceae bacterium]